MYFSFKYFEFRDFLVIFIFQNEKEIQVNENIYVAELATCNSSSPCYTAVDELRNKEVWRCDKHKVGGESPNLLGVWYPVKVV
jgi:hypothetical protein